jgi:hypothetical protein|eukprot:CAMPEP_0174368032 /NCGR_PEP_ID=MMETSP0811_2-20130205/87562_1 /TAXON_ID=73025 ORGANISM="Eutreptiella gymnastica-like, Strain CCMP1594" /NCGR_SAMPLE_ID=MMETSP0811_2 /ASSEMBLY_ACC=CAM_ASM_000667 /LENGTH=34 /DNA_ID= /DNA_START= /DNA_END= /DNA_ORIENTATION=
MQVAEPEIASELLYGNGSKEAIGPLLNITEAKMQ